VQDVFPEVGGAVASCGVWGVASAAAVASVEGEEVGGGSGEAGGHPDGFGVEGEVDEGAAFEFKEGFAGFAVFAVLGFGLFGGLSGKGVFEFEGNEGDAVEGEGDVDYAVGGAVGGVWAIGGFCFFIGFAVLELAGDGELVGLVLGFELGVEAVGGFEGGDVEGASVAFEAVAEDLQAAVGVEPFAEVGEDLGGGVGAVELFEACPFLGLGVLDEVEGGLGEEGAIAVVLFGAEGGVAVGEEVGFDDAFKVGFGVDGHGVGFLG
jgi:hypothetical protein